MFHNRDLTWFFVLFLVRYVRVIINIYGNARYRPVPIPKIATYHASDITVVIPTTEIMAESLHQVIKSSLVHDVSKLIIPAAGPKAKEQLKSFKKAFPDPRVVLLYRDTASRREQTAQAMPRVNTSLMILQDDHTFWPASPDFLPSLLAPFEDPQTGAVSSNVQARHCHHCFSFAGFWNFLGMIYLARRHHEYCATYGIDGGISTLPGRFGVYRTEIYASKEFLQGYLNDMFLGRPRPLNSDDDKFHTRWLISHDWKIALQAGPESTMIAELGEWPKFPKQVLRWMRTTWRSSPRQLFSWHYVKTWTKHPYMSLSLFLWFFRMSLIHEVSMFVFLKKALKEAEMLDYFPFAAGMLGAWIVGMKFNKVFPHFQKYPSDIVYFPGYLVFGYWCSFVKIWALLTCLNTTWETASTANSYKPQERLSLIKEGHKLDMQPKKQVKAYDVVEE